MAVIETSKIQTSFFFLIFALVGVLVFLIYRPFLEIIFISVIFAVALQPVFRRVLRVVNNNRQAAAFLTLLLAVTFIAVPIYFIGIQIFEETSNLYATVSSGDGGASFMARVGASVDNTVNKFLPGSSFSLKDSVQNFVGVIYENIGRLLSGTAFFLLGLLLVFLSVFFFLKDGPLFIEEFLRLSPLDDKYDRDILSTFNKTIKSVLLGTLAVETIQGFVLMAGFSIFGVPNAFLWGSLTIVFAAVPGLGPMVVFIPGIVYLFYINHTAAAIGLILWSFFMHGSVDNFLAPMFYGRGIGIHPILVMFAILGGLLFFGPLGFLFGPIALSVFFALFHIYRIFILEEKETE